MDDVITVDEQDNALGRAGKLEAHLEGLLHRAFSVFIFNERQELLLQRRAMGKYHSGGLWTNTCCSHPAPGEDNMAAAHRRLGEELGFDCPLSYLQAFRYKAKMSNGLTENEYDHIFTGTYSGPIHPDPEEVMAFEYRSLPDIRAWVESSPAAFTEWFRMILPLFDRR